MTNDRLTTCEKEKPTLLSQRTVYLTLIAEEIRSYGIAHSTRNHIKLPSNLSIDYLKFSNSYWDTLEKCLRNFKGMFLSDLKGKNDEYKNEIIDLYTNQTSNSIQETIKYIDEKISSKKRELPFKLIENVHVSAKVQELLEKRAISKVEREESEKRIKEIEIKLRDLPPTTIDKLEVKITDIAANSLMIEAINHAIKRAKLSKEEEKKFQFKKFKNNTEEIYNDLLFNSRTCKIKKSKLKKTNAEIINEAANDYEIIGNPTYLHNKRKFKKTLGEYFRPRLKELRKKHGNS